MNHLVGCRDMEILCRHRAAVDSTHRWKWLGKAERWGHLAAREAARKYPDHAGPMAVGPNRIEGDLPVRRLQSAMGGR
jgi:hypothetical protein